MKEPQKTTAVAFRATRATRRQIRLIVQEHGNFAAWVRRAIAREAERLSSSATKVAA